MHDSEGVHERKFCGRDIFRKSGIVHDPANAEVGEQKTVNVLPNQLWEFASKHDPAASKVRLELIKGSLDGPSLRIQPGQFDRRRLDRIQNVGDQPVVLPEAVDPVVDQSDQDAFTVLSPMLGRRVELGQIRSVGQLPQLR